MDNNTNDYTPEIERAKKQLENSFFVWLRPNIPQGARDAVDALKKIFDAVKPETMHQIIEAIILNRDIKIQIHVIQSKGK